MHDILNKFIDLFSTANDQAADINPVSVELKESAKPVFCKPRQVPFAWKEKVEKKLERLVENGIFEPTYYSEWATPIVPMERNLSL